MAQTGVASLQLFAWPAGSDKTQRKLVLEGNVFISSSSTTPIAITAWAISTNVLTFTAVNSLAGTEDINVSGFTGGNAFLNGTYTLTSATGTTMVTGKTHADGSATAAGTAVLTPEYVTDGLPITYTFTNPSGTNIQPPIGPAAVPTWITVYSAAGGAYNYKVNQTVTPNTLRIYNGVTELSNAGDITADTVYFRAEFPYGQGGGGVY